VPAASAARLAANAVVPVARLTANAVVPVASAARLAAVYQIFYIWIHHFCLLRQCLIPGIKNEAS
jgi:hypothetical protein